METLHLHHPARPPHMISPSHGPFTDTELSAAELLVQLSGSSDTAEDRASSSSPGSVNARPLPLRPETAMLLENEEEDEETGPGRRRTQRYRPIAEVYAATTPSGGVDRGAERRRKKRAKGED